MKKRFFIFVFLIVILVFNMISYAVTTPEPEITSHKYSIGDKMKEKETTDVQIGKKLQLYVVISYGNDMRMEYRILC